MSDRKKLRLMGLKKTGRIRPYCLECRKKIAGVAAGPHAPDCPTLTIEWNQRARIDAENRADWALDRYADALDIGRKHQLAAANLKHELAKLRQRDRRTKATIDTLTQWLVDYDEGGSVTPFTMNSTVAAITRETLKMLLGFDNEAQIESYIGLKIARARRQRDTEKVCP